MLSKEKIYRKGSNMTNCEIQECQSQSKHTDMPYLYIYMSARPLPIKASDMGIDTRKSISTTLYFPSPSVLYTLYNI